jgi:hypothetical protein
MSDPKFNPAESELLLKRIAELEEQNAKKDVEIGALQDEIVRLKEVQKPHTAPVGGKEGQPGYKELYERIKFQYDKLREALAVDGKMKRVRLRSARQLKVRV